MTRSSFGQEEEKVAFLGEPEVENFRKEGSSSSNDQHALLLVHREGGSRAGLFVVLCPSRNFFFFLSWESSENTQERTTNSFSSVSQDSSENACFLCLPKTGSGCPLRGPRPVHPPSKRRCSAAACSRFFLDLTIQGSFYLFSLDMKCFFTSFRSLVEFCCFSMLP